MQKHLMNSQFTKIICEDYHWLKSIDLPWNKLLGQKILITGANGFIASNLICFLANLNVEFDLDIKITGLVRDYEKAQEKFNSINIDFGLLELVERSIFEPLRLDDDYTAIFHLASLASPKFFKTNPIEVALPNTLGTVNLLKFAEKCPHLSIFVFFSTTGVNGFVDDKLRPIDESEYGGLDPNKISNSYLVSKAMGENFCYAWSEQKNVPIQIIRPAITYGPGFDLNDGRSYADFVSNILNNENIVLHSSGGAIRNFCYIADFISGFFHVIFRGDSPATFNVCSERETSIKSLAIMMTKELFPEKNISVEFDFTSGQHLRINFEKTTVSNSKIRSLGWNEHFTLAEGMKRTVASFSK